MSKTKRIVFAFCIIISHLALSACGPKTPPPAPAQFSAQADIVYGGKAIAARLEQQAPGVLLVEFTAPEELRDMRLSLQGDSAVLRYGDMQTELPADSLPAAGFAPLLCQVLLRLAQPGEEGFARAKGGGWTLKGIANGLSYRAKITPEGTLSQVDVPAAALEVTLSLY